MSTSETLVNHLPKLPELDRKDIEVIRGFLPGKLLGRTAALLSLALLVLSFTIGVDQAAKRLYAGWPPPPWLRFALLPGLALLAVAVQLLIEWRTERSRRALQRLAVRLGAEQSGYFRIGPYLDIAEDRARFDRADRAHEKVLSWIERSANVPLYLTGDSGSGKSSLLNASVLPALRERGWTVVEARAWQDPEAALGVAITQLRGSRQARHGEKPGLRDLIEAAAQRANKHLLLVLDQFEEFLILGKHEQKQQFANLLAELRAIPVKRLSLLLVLRSDYQALLEEVGLPPMRQGENFYQVGRFTLGAAGDFLKRSGLELQPAATDHLLTSAAELDETPGLVRPITLNVIGYVLAGGKATASSLDAGQLVRQYIEQTVGQPAIRNFAPRVLEQLITEQGTKCPRSEQELAGSTHLRRGEIRAVLNGLGSAALARPLDPRQGVWELSHDFIARAVARYLGRQRRDLLQQSAFYAAPALLTAMLMIGAGVIGWEHVKPDHTISQLNQLGLTVAKKAEGQTAEGTSQLTTESLVQAAPLLGRLIELRSLNLSTGDGGGIASIEPLKGLTALRVLDLSVTEVENLEPLKGLTSLQELQLYGTKVRSVEPLKGLTALQSLGLRSTKVKNIEPLEGLTALQELDLSETKVRSVQPLRGLTTLQWLSLRKTKVEDIEPLKGLTALQLLSLRETTVNTFEPLKNLKALQSLDLNGTRIGSLEPLQGLTTLQWLDVGGTEVGDLKPIPGLTAMQRLVLSGTKVENLEPLSGLAALQELDLSGTKVDNLEPLRGLAALQELDLSRTKVDNLKPLQDLAALRRLSLSGTVPEEELVRFNRYRQEKNLQPVEFHSALGE
jgi:Leucine-rich repeat (LRR) protein